MLARLFQILIFSILSIGITSAASAADQQAPQSPPQPKIVNTNADANLLIQPLLGAAKLNSGGGAMCSDVANQIMTVSKSKTQEKVFPWENLTWLEKNLGTPREVQFRENKAYMWICINPTGSASMIMYLVVNKQGVNHIMYQSMICLPQQPCAAYGFERNGSTIIGSALNTKDFAN